MFHDLVSASFSHTIPYLPGQSLLLTFPTQLSPFYLHSTTCSYSNLLCASCFSPFVHVIPFVFLCLSLLAPYPSSLRTFSLVELFPPLFLFLLTSLKILLCHLGFSRVFCKILGDRTSSCTLLYTQHRA